MTGRAVRRIRLGADRRGRHDAHLVHVQFDLQHRHDLLEFGVMPRGPVDGLWHELQDEVEVDFILLKGTGRLD